MNRLWVRLSLAYTATIVAVVLLLLLIIVLVPASPDFIPPAVSSSADRAAWQQLRSSGVLQTLLRELVLRQFLGALVLMVLAGVVTSVAASRRLTRPLERLAGATRKVSHHGERPRVPIEGTREMVGLAEAFNGMVGELEAAEARRQTLLADVSHELRTPLTVLQGNLRSALDDPARLDPAMVATLYDQTRQLGHLVDDLHDLAQAESNRLPLTMAGLDLATLLRQAADLFGPLAEEQGVRLVVETPVALPPLRGDRARLTQVLQNLLANALRYAHSQIRLVADREGDRALLRVADDGPGIAAEHLPHLFDRFYRTDPSRSRASGGSGLGLAIVRSIVEAHGWAITVTSRQTPPAGARGGTTFTIAIPLNPADPHGPPGSDLK